LAERAVKGTDLRAGEDRKGKRKKDRKMSREGRKKMFRNRLNKS